MNKLEVGQKLYLVTSGRFDRYKEVTVSKVGKMYFYIEEDKYAKFYIDTLWEDNGKYSSKERCYLSIQEIKDAMYEKAILRKLKDFFLGYGTPNVSVDKLRKIDKILFGDEE